MLQMIQWCIDVKPTEHGEAGARPRTPNKIQRQMSPCSNSVRAGKMFLCEQRQCPWSNGAHVWSVPMFKQLLLMFESLCTNFCTCMVACTQLATNKMILFLYSLPEVRLYWTTRLEAHGLKDCVIYGTFWSEREAAGWVSPNSRLMWVEVDDEPLPFSPNAGRRFRDGLWPGNPQAR